MTSRTWMPLAATFAFVFAFLTAEGLAKATNCVDDSDCPSATPACNGGLCAECTTANATKCTAAGAPICLMPYGVCGCESDAQCGGTNSGLLCTRLAPASISAPYCRAGCAAGRNACDTGQGYACNNGQCSKLCALGGCTSTPSNVCRTLLTCVQCTSETDCNGKPAAPHCDTSAGICVQCNTSGDCAGNNHGPLCRGASTGPGIPASPERSCGCNVDSDCGASRICDGTLKVCMDGCRVAGGGKCPPGNQCLLAPDGGQACVPTPDGGGVRDSGTGDAGPIGDGSTGDSGSRDAGLDSGSGGTGDDNGYGTTLEGGGWSCSMSPVEDALPVGGLVALGGMLAFFTRRRSRKE